MTSSFQQEMERRLAAIRDQGLLRQLRRVDSAQGPRLTIDGRVVRNFSSNDYLGLADHPALKQAAVAAVEKYGAGAGASRLICGSLAPHHELDEALAAFKGTPAALSFSSGYATALGVIHALMPKGTVVVIDKLVHASIVDAARMAGAKLRVFAHNDLNDLEDILKWAARVPPGGASPAQSSRPPQTLVVTESLFSMDGDRAPLRALVELKEKYGAWLMVDEAHATGLYGKNRRGLAEEAGVADRIEVQMGTLGKALGAAGGYIAGSRPLIDYLINQARSLIFSTAPVPAAAAAALAGLRLVRSDLGEHRVRELWARVSQAEKEIAGRVETAGSPPRGAIVPVVFGEEVRALSASAALLDRGIFVPAIRFPTVARGSARLRLTFTAAHLPEDVSFLAEALRDLGVNLPSGFPQSSPAVPA